MSYRYDKVYQQLSLMLISGEYPPGSRFPNEIHLARQLNVARVTLRTALERLEKEHRIIRSRSGGTVVSSGKNNASTVLLLSEIYPEHIRQNPCLFIASGIEQRCEELGWKLEYMTPDLLPEKLPEDHHILGIIVNAHNFCGSEPMLQKLRRLQLPVVAVHGYAHDPEITGFMTLFNDYKSAWKDGLIHLKRMGHRRVAFLNLGRKYTFPRLNMTEKEMMQFINEEGLAMDRKLFLYDNALEKHLPDIVNDWRKWNSPPTAAFCFSDYFAAKLYVELKKHHMRIPEDMAVLGFGGDDGVEKMTPPLSTVDLGYRRMGKTAVDMLEINCPTKKKNGTAVVYLPHQIIARQSTDRFIPVFR